MYNDFQLFFLNTKITPFNKSLQFDSVGFNTFSDLMVYYSHRFQPERYCLSRRSCSVYRSNSSS
jgi:hypothetical protein